MVYDISVPLKYFLFLIIIHFTLFFLTYIHIYFYIFIFIYLMLSNKMPVQTRSTRVKAPAISGPDNVPVEALSTNETAT